MSDETPQVEETPQVIEPELVENTSVEFKDDDQLGVEFIKIFIKDTKEGKGFDVKLVHKPGIEENLPHEFISYVMSNVGKFMMHAVHELYKSSVAAAMEEEQENRNKDLEHAIKKARKGQR